MQALTHTACVGRASEDSMALVVHVYATCPKQLYSQQSLTRLSLVPMPGHNHHQSDAAANASYLCPDHINAESC